MYVSSRVCIDEPMSWDTSVLTFCPVGGTVSCSPNPAASELLEDLHSLRPISPQECWGDRATRPCPSFLMWVSKSWAQVPHLHDICFAHCLSTSSRTQCDPSLRPPAVWLFHHDGLHPQTVSQNEPFLYWVASVKHFVMINNKEVNAYSYVTVSVHYCGQLLSCSKCISVLSWFILSSDWVRRELPPLSILKPLLLYCSPNQGFVASEKQPLLPIHFPAAAWVGQAGVSSQETVRG